jgi:hypothetical protein
VDCEKIKQAPNTAPNGLRRGRVFSALTSFNNILVSFISAQNLEFSAPIYTIDRMQKKKAFPTAQDTYDSIMGNVPFQTSLVV